MALAQLSKLRQVCKYSCSYARTRQDEIIKMCMSQSSKSGIYNPPEKEQPPIPVYKARDGETTVVKRARLVYQSRKRGMLENGLLLSTFASKYLDKLTESQLDLYDTLINEPSNDWDIYYWMVAKKDTPVEYNNEVMDMLKEHAQNKDRELRSHQPALYTS